MSSVSLRSLRVDESDGERGHSGVGDRSRSSGFRCRWHLERERKTFQDSEFPNDRIEESMLYYLEMSIYEKRLTRAGRRARGGMSGHPEREGGGGQPCSTETQIPDSEFPSFRVSEAPPWVRRGTPTSRFHVSKCADSRILLCKFQITSFRVSEAPSWVRSGGTPKFQIPSFRVSEEHPSWVLAQGTPKFQIPSFRVSEAPSSVQGRWNPKFQIPSFRVSEDPSWVAGRSKRDPQIP